MFPNIVLNDALKVLRGASIVSKTALVNQIEECNIFLSLMGVQNCIRSLKSISVTSTGAKECVSRACDRTRLMSKELEILVRHACTDCPPYVLPNGIVATTLTSSPDFGNHARQFSSSSSNPNQRKLLKYSKQRHVPSSRIGRAVGFGNLFVGLGLGAAAELARRSLTPSSAQDSTANLFLTDANIEKIVDTLCRMRGAALKLGQMLSIQDSSLVNPKIQQLFERVRQAADFMPTSQMYQIINTELGPNWKDNVLSFEEKPFAAASIGQVHMAILPDNRKVAIKIQYPGISQSIDTDVANIMMLLKRFELLPRGLFAADAIRVAKKELQWECDYVREASYAEKFSRYLTNDPVFVVPRVIPELSKTRVFTSEYYDGMVLDDCVNLPQDVRNWIGENILRLCLLEVFVYNTMQTDPNWSNFLYCPDIQKIVLLDFGASREYSRKFVDDYLRVIVAATRGDKAAILKHSKDLGFLTGYETKAFTDAHTMAISVLGEAFASEKPFDFGRQSTTRRINSIIPVMLEHRLTPPPVETYSLHRKMSGCFLLCGKLGAVVDCRNLFLQIAESYQYGLENTPEMVS